MSGASSTFGAAPAFDAVVYSAEMLRQSAQQKAMSDFGNRLGAQPAADEIAAMRAAEIAKFKSLLAAALASGCSPSVFLQALRELGAQ